MIFFPLQFPLFSSPPVFFLYACSSSMYVYVLFSVWESQFYAQLYLSLCLSIYLSVCLSVCLSVYLLQVSPHFPSPLQYFLPLMITILGDNILAPPLSLPLLPLPLPLSLLLHSLSYSLLPFSDHYLFIQTLLCIIILAFQFHCLSSLLSYSYLYLHVLVFSSSFPPFFPLFFLFFPFFSPSMAVQIVFFIFIYL